MDRFYWYDGNLKPGNERQLINVKNVRLYDGDDKVCFFKYCFNTALYFPKNNVTYSMTDYCSYNILCYPGRIYNNYTYIKTFLINYIIIIFLK